MGTDSKAALELTVVLSIAAFCLFPGAQLVPGI